MERRLDDTFTDRVVIGLDTALRTLTGHYRSERPSPGAALEEPRLERAERRHSAGLMRVNHAGEVCAQALYEGQAVTAHTDEVREVLRQAACEEEDHLAWCHERLEELDSAPSLLNPLWYAGSFAIGAGAGLLGDRVSLGFVAATEDQVCRHLERHLESLPEADERSRAVLEQMHADESRHGTSALTAGGVEFPEPVKALMTFVSGAMTGASYYL